MEVSVLVTDVMLADAAEKMMLASHEVSLPFSDDVMMGAVGNLAEAFALPMRLQIGAYAVLMTRRERKRQKNAGGQPCLPQHMYACPECGAVEGEPCRFGIPLREIIVHRRRPVPVEVTPSQAYGDDVL